MSLCQKAANEALISFIVLLFVFQDSTCILSAGVVFFPPYCVNSIYIMHRNMHEREGM